MSVPMYIFTGFLDSGKSTFIQDTLRDPAFHDGERTLLLICEDGEVEYDEAVLAAYDTDLLYIEHEEDLTFDFLNKLDQQYHPDRVMIEFNGMWSFTSFLEVEFPINWMLVQILTTVDASTFAMYMNNMRSILYEQMVHSEVIIFNRCDETTKKSFLRGNVKAINKVAQIIYESVDGKINQLADDVLPFDTTKDAFEIAEDDYGLWYMDALEHPQSYVGKTVTFVGQIIEVERVQGEMFLIAREAMVCCADDIQMIGFVVYHRQSSSLKVGDWIKLTARMDCEFDESYGGEVPVLYANKIEDIDAITSLVTFS